MQHLPDWRCFANAVHTAYVAPSSQAAVSFMGDVGAAAETADHHPDLDWRYDHVFLRITSYDVGQVVTARDTRLAAQISDLARDAGMRAEPAKARTVEIGIDTTDPQSLVETWRTALGYTQTSEGDLVDPWSRGPLIWFQHTDSPATSRLHVDSHVTPSAAPQLLDDVEAAGGRRLDDRFAPSWWVIGDHDGNRICICTPEDPGQ